MTRCLPNWRDGKFQKEAEGFGRDWPAVANPPVLLSAFPQGELGVSTRLRGPCTGWQSLPNPSGVLSVPAWMFHLACGHSHLCSDGSHNGTICPNGQYQFGSIVKLTVRLNRRQDAIVEVKVL